MKFIPKIGHNTCPGCHGTGVQRNTQTGLTQTCPVCHGTGKYIKPIFRKSYNKYTGKKIK